VNARLLIATGGAASGADALPFGVRELIDAADEILVIAPALPTRLQWLMSDTDQARKQADERLSEVLGQLDALGTEATGAVGSDDPLEAFEDAIRDFDPGHLLIGLREGEHAAWQERGLLDRIQQTFGLPMTVFSVPAG
jgi:hypothetical protein